MIPCIFVMFWLYVYHCEKNTRQTTGRKGEFALWLQRAAVHHIWRGEAEVEGSQWLWVDSPNSASNWKPNVLNMGSRGTPDPNWNKLFKFWNLSSLFLFCPSTFPIFISVSRSAKHSLQRRLPFSLDFSYSIIFSFLYFHDDKEASFIHVTWRALGFLSNQSPATFWVFLKLLFTSGENQQGNTWWKNYIGNCLCCMITCKSF